MEKIVSKIKMGGEEYKLAPEALFYAGDSWDRSVEYAVEPAISACAKGITFHCDTDDIKIGTTTLANAINESPTAVSAVVTANSAIDRIDSLESSISYIKADTNSLYDKVSYLNEKLDALSFVADQEMAGPKKVGKAFAALAEKMKDFQQKDTGGKITLEDLIEPGEAAWIEKMDLKTRQTGTFKKSRLLTI